VNTAEVKNILIENGLSPNKKLGQNFLVSSQTRNRILALIGPGPGISVLEIGPGLGALTGYLLDSGAVVTAIELDRGLHGFLAARYAGRPGLTLVHGDFLRQPVDKNIGIIAGNLPYYCSSEILFKLVDWNADRAIVMLQKEMAERITSAPGGKNYGAICVTLGLYFKLRIEFAVPPDSFYPQPGVASAVLNLERRGEQPLSTEAAALFHLLVKSSFWGRRKTILKALADSPHLDLSRAQIIEALRGSGINQTIRGEELDLESYIELAKNIIKISG
jgi:16S rRNA (adenine1518-N6/adenine1519-N6)-dimethyltransferase